MRNTFCCLKLITMYKHDKYNAKIYKNIGTMQDIVVKNLKYFIKKFINNFISKYYKPLFFT
jgi:hypothetical protein